jgi:bacillithiol synthase
MWQSGTVFTNAGLQTRDDCSRSYLASRARLGHLNYGRRSASLCSWLTYDDLRRPTYANAGTKAATRGALSVKAHCLPFSQIPHTTRLFSDLLAYAPGIRPFFPRSPYFSEWANDEAAKIAYDSLRREKVSQILERQSQSRNASAKTVANVERFRRGAAAVVTGQQVGLFGGPMFAIYKALTAVKLAEQATAAGIEAVPIFWLATYDHDLAEVNHVSFPGSDGTLQQLTTPSHGIAGAPVSSVDLGEEILPVLDQAATLLGENEAVSLLRETYRPGETLGTAFARLYAKLFAEWGVIVLDASDPDLHRVAEPIYRAAVERAEELSSALLARGEALEAAGYHQQVKVTSTSSLLFVLQDGARVPVHLHLEDEQLRFMVGSDGAAKEISSADLLVMIADKPEQFSPNVLMRPVVQDFLLPTIAYTGGAAEAAYFAQAAVVFQILLGRTTPIVPRYSATIVEPKIQRLLERYGISVLDAFSGCESLRQKLAAHSLPEDLQAAFDSAKKSFDAHLNTIKEGLAKLDRTLVDAGETAVSKMNYQLERLHAQAGRAESQKKEVVGRHAETITHALYPEKGLQERAVGGLYFVARYGRELLHQLYDCMQTDCHDHQILQI